MYAMFRTKDFGLNKDRVFDVVFAGIVCGFLGARIYYCVFQTLNPNSLVNYNFITTFTTIRDGGLAIYGGIIGAFLSGFIACKVRKVHFLAMADIASLGLLIGQTLGRWGNFINQEAYGAICSDNWLFGMSGTYIAIEVGAGKLVHPCFLYESAWCLLGFIILHFYSKKLRSYDGEITLLYIAWYGLGRAFIESLRSDSLMIGQFKVSQLLAAGSFITSAVLFVVFKIYTEKKGIKLYVNSEACAELMAADQMAEEERLAKKEAKKIAPSILADDYFADEESENADEESESADADENDSNSSENEAEETADNKEEEK